MFKDLFQIYQIGKELGLTKKEINGKIILYVILITILFLFGLTIMLFNINFTRNIYPSGAEYSTIRIKDFKKKY